MEQIRAIVSDVDSRRRITRVLCVSHAARDQWSWMESRDLPRHASLNRVHIVAIDDMVAAAAAAAMERLLWLHGVHG